MNKVLQKLRQQQIDCANKAAECRRRAEVLTAEEAAFRMAADMVEDEIKRNIVLPGKTA